MAGDSNPHNLLDLSGTLSRPGDPVVEWDDSCGSGIGIDPDQVPAATFSKDEVDQLRSLIAAVGLVAVPKGVAHGIVEHLVNGESRPVLRERERKVPVDVERTVKALLKRPRLAWDVARELRTKLVGAWNEKSPGVWQRKALDGDRCGWVAFEGGKFRARCVVRSSPPPFDTLEEAKGFIDESLEAHGYTLVSDR